MRLVDEMRAGEGRHKRALEALREQCRKELEDARGEGSARRMSSRHIQRKHWQYSDAVVDSSMNINGFATVEAKDLEVKMVLEEKDLDLQEMKKRLKDQEKEKQSELLKIQMEVTFLCVFYVYMTCIDLLTVDQHTSERTNKEMSSAEVSREVGPASPSAPV